MAYIALSALLLSLAVLFIMAFSCGDSFKEIKDSSLLISIEAFLTAIVGAYYGVSMAHGVPLANVVSRIKNDLYRGRTEKPSSRNISPTGLALSGVPYPTRVFRT